jgi:2-polyprenyl-3-methyl-5-hydroxy-6-metoxy-1,4-benzoquinol methylase
MPTCGTSSDVLQSDSAFRNPVQLFSKSASSEQQRAEAEVARQRALARGETNAVRLPSEGLSTDKILRATIDKIHDLAPNVRGDYLDVGAGNGELIDRIIRTFPVTPHACDYRDDLMTMGNVEVAVADLNRGPLPYADASFDLVTCTEVIEHLEHYRFAIREIWRVLRPGGICVISTPNVLNLRSRLRYLFFGFFNMFGPLRVGDDRHHSTHGHINPVPYFYLAHALANTGFRGISVSIDKLQRGSWLPLAVLWLPLRIYERFAVRKEREKYKTLDETNERFVRALNRREMLLGRTIVVGCRKL